jgi:hypothetical protein
LLIGESAMSFGEIARALPTAFAHSHLDAHAEFVRHALRMRKANRESRVPFWDPHVFLGHRIATRLMRLPGAVCPPVAAATLTASRSAPLSTPRSAPLAPAGAAPVTAPASVFFASAAASAEAAAWIAAALDTGGLTAIAQRILAEDLATASGAQRAARAWDDAAFDDELPTRRLATLLAWSAVPVVIRAPRERLAAAWRHPWPLAAPVQALRALGPAGYYVTLGPGFASDGLQDERLDHWLEGLYVCLDEHVAPLRRQYDLDVVLLHYDLREGVHDTVGCVPLDPALSIAAARNQRIAAALADGRRAPALTTLSVTTAMRIVALLLDLVPDVNYLAAWRRLQWNAG